MKKHFERLKSVKWGSAREWNPSVRNLLLDYYKRILPVWPEDREKILPHSSLLIEPFSKYLSSAEKEHVELMLRSVFKAAEMSGVVLTLTSQALITLILTCAVLRGKGDLKSNDDPSEPLLRLFELGYDLNPTHGAIDICYQEGCTSMQLPTREAIAHTVASNNDLGKTIQKFIKQRQMARNFILKGVILHGITLDELRADSLNFEEADLSESSLKEVNWKGCILRDARLEGADFTHAILRLCNLDQARATNTIFIKTRVENSTACAAGFDNTNFSKAILTDTDFSRASFRDANLESVSASGASFRGADMRGANLYNADLSDADLRGADLTDANLEGVNLRGADLRGVVGNDPVLQKAEGQWDELSPEMRNLAETMTPIVSEVLRTAGRQGVIDPAITQQLIDETAKQAGVSPRNAPDPEALEAVSRIVSELGDNALPVLFGALQSKESEPPEEVKSMILQLRDALGLDEKATAEDVLTQFLRNLGKR